MDSPMFSISTLCPASMADEIYAWKRTQTLEVFHHAHVALVDIGCGPLHVRVVLRPVVVLTPVLLAPTCAQVTEARETEVAINENRNKYRPVAQRGAMLFFLLNSLNKIHAFYQFSLNAFVTVFSRGLDLAPGGRRKKEDMSLKQVREQSAGQGRLCRL